MEICWNEEKNEWLKNNRNLSFEMVQDILYHEQKAIELPHPNRERYPNQKILLLKIDDYVHMVPCIEEDEILFLKTIIPSRKFHKFFSHLL